MKKKTFPEVVNSPIGKRALFRKISIKGPKVNILLKKQAYLGDGEYFPLEFIFLSKKIFKNDISVFFCFS